MVAAFLLLFLMGLLLCLGGSGRAGAFGGWDNRKPRKLETWKQFHRAVDDQKVVVFKYCHCSTQWCQEMSQLWDTFVVHQRHKFSQSIIFATIPVASEVCSDDDDRQFPSLIFYEHGTMDAPLSLSGLKERDMAQNVLLPVLQREMARRVDDIRKELSPKVHSLNEETFHLFLEQHQSVLVFYHVEWCSYCRKMVNLIHQLARIDFIPYLALATVDCSKFIAACRPITENNVRTTTTTSIVLFPVVETL